MILRATVWACAGLLVITMLPGCSGCLPDSVVERKKELDDIDKRKQKEEPEPDFKMTPSRTLPPDERPMSKPGHWVAADHEIKANNFNYNAELRTAATDSQGATFPIPRTNFQLAGSQPAKLPRGQAKVFETTYFIPYEAANISKQVWLNRELRAARGGRLVMPPDRVPITTMPPHQYFVVVLSSGPDRYAFMNRLTSVEVPIDDPDAMESLRLYRVVMPVIERITPLPDNPLTWTGIAYLLLDDFDPGTLTRGQEEALMDWLHWGGQVIISGPRSLDKLRGSFLEPYLPATAGRTQELAAESIEQLDGFWSLPPHPVTQVSRSLKLLPGVPLTGVELLRHPDTIDVPQTGGLVCERTVGRGRIVVTSFALTDRYLLQWGPSYDSFINGCLLRRPPREFAAPQILAVARHSDLKRPIGDPRLGSRLRYLTRDVTSGSVRHSASLDESVSPEEAWGVVDDVPAGPGGVAAWNDESGFSEAARNVLEDAAGISIPQGNFVLRVLAVYLLVVAPLNWGVFRMLGRVEWAWLAAPMIAVVGALAVVRLAQLDIGFARSTTEVAVVEMHGGYPRAHVTRYTALYTSLSTGYDVSFEEVPSVSQPFASRTNRRSGSETIHEVVLRQEAAWQLDGFQVASNSIGYLHSEQVYDLGGAITLVGDDETGWTIANGSDLALNDVGLVRRLTSGAIETAWLDEVASRTTAPVAFRAAPADSSLLPEWDRSLATLSYEAQQRQIFSRLDTDGDSRLTRDEVSADPVLADSFDRLDLKVGDDRGVWTHDEVLQWCRESRSGELSLGELMQLAAWRPNLVRGEVRLVGWTDQELPHLLVRPSSAQAKRRVLVVVHLQSGPLPPAKPDVNCKADVVDVTDEDLEEADLLMNGDAERPDKGPQVEPDATTDADTRASAKPVEPRTTGSDSAVPP